MSVVSKAESEYPGESGSEFTVSLLQGSSHLPDSLVNHSARPNRHGVSQSDMEL